MPCEKMRELENAWKRQYEAATYFECSKATAALPMAKKTLMRLIRECRTDGARAASAIQTHQRHCSVCGDRRVGSQAEGPIKVASYFRRHVLVVGAILLLSPLAALSGNRNTHSGVAGIYLSHAGKKDPSMSVSLRADRTATVTQDPGKRSMTLFGHWADDGDRIKITFDAAEGAPLEPPMVFQPSHDGLQAITWNHAAWAR